MLTNQGEVWFRACYPASPLDFKKSSKEKV